MLFQLPETRDVLPSTSHSRRLTTSFPPWEKSPNFIHTSLSRKRKRIRFHELENVPLFLLHVFYRKNAFFKNVRYVFLFSELKRTYHSFLATDILDSAWWSSKKIYAEAFFFTQKFLSDCKALALSDIWEENYSLNGRCIFSIFDYEQLFLCVASKSNADFSHQSEQSISCRQNRKKSRMSRDDLQLEGYLQKKWTQFIAISSPAESWKWRPSCGSRSFCSPLLSRPTSLPPFPKIRGALGKERRRTPISWTATIW